MELAAVSLCVWSVPHVNSNLSCSSGYVCIACCEDAAIIMHVNTGGESRDVHDIFILLFFRGHKGGVEAA